MQHSSQEMGQVEDNPQLASQFFGQYKALKAQGKKYEAWDKLGLAVKYGYNTVAEISDQGYLVANQIEDESLALFNGDAGEPNDRFYSEAYELLDRYLIFDVCMTKKPLTRLRARCLECFDKFHENTMKSYQYAQHERAPLYNRINNLNIAMRASIDEEKRQMNRLRETLIPRFKAELLEKIPAMCEAATSHEGYQKAHEICQEAEKAVPEVPFFKGLRLYVLLRVKTEQFSTLDDALYTRMGYVADVDSDIDMLMQDVVYRHHVVNAECAMLMALDDNNLDEAKRVLGKMTNFGHCPEIIERCTDKFKDRLRLEFLKAYQDGDVSAMQELLGPNRLAEYGDIHAPCQQKLIRYQNDLKQVKHTAERIALEVVLRCRDDRPFKSRNDQKSYDALTKALHHSVLTSMNQGDRNRFLIDFRRYLESKKGQYKDPYKEDRLVNELMEQLVNKLNATCFEESKGFGKKVKLKVDADQFDNASVDSIIATRTEKFQPDQERVGDISSSHNSDTASGVHTSSEDGSPPSSRSHSPKQNTVPMGLRQGVAPRKALPKAPSQVVAPQATSQGRRRKAAPKIGKLATNGPVFGAGQQNGPQPTAPPLSPSTQVYGYSN